eukprot:3191875-Prymnesium_polylepis.1
MEGGRGAKAPRRREKKGERAARRASEAREAGGASRARIMAARTSVLRRDAQPELAPAVVARDDEDAHAQHALAVEDA